MDKIYEPQQYEDEIYKRWEASGFFNPDVCIEKGITDKKAKPFTIVLPPPNATGALHIGHAMMLAIEDLMIRYHRMKGDKTLWVPGTDHAAIATNAVVERQLAKEGKTKYDLGREKYVERVKKYIKNSQDNIRNQVRKMGSSLDWSREAYTWDEKRNLAVRTMFKKMYDDGLIYRGYRIVNWCPRCHSTLADDEVEYREQKAKLYTFRYSKSFPFAISTTRPETKLGDTAVAVNSGDWRYRKYIGQTFAVKSFVGGADLELKVIGDREVNMDFGTGAVGLTPAHSHTDYEIAQKNNLPLLKIIDEDGKMTKEAGKPYFGLTVSEAREKAVENLKKKGLLEKEEEIDNNLSICYRCGTAIEPLPSRQWFINVSSKFKVQSSKLQGVKNGEERSLKELMQRVVESGQIEIIPERFTKTYFHWIDNLRDWCISRQIWVGHQIPVWYKGEEIYVGTEPFKGEGWTQDPDTLDTWFSSGLWTFSTLGWPDLKATDLEIYHPTSVLETMFDILFFWVARMIMMSTYALGEIPFEKVYLHARVLDKDGEKMSKSKPETMIDPLDVCRKYGTDAVRLSLLIGVGPAADVRLSEEKIAGFRNFANKLWNIARFILTQINTDGDKIDHRSQITTHSLADKWILERLTAVAKQVTDNIEKFNFSLAGEVLRDFTWGELADWYLEIAKIESGSAPQSGAAPDKVSKREILRYILETILKLWHPFMPFVTEQIWSEIYGKDKILMVEQWPDFVRPGRDCALPTGRQAGKPQSQFNLIKSIITGIRSLRADYKIEPARKLKALISASKHTKLLEENKAVIIGLARLESLEIKRSAKKPVGSVGFIVGGVEVFAQIFVGTGLDLSVQMAKEKARLQKEIADLEKYVFGLKNKLANQNFRKNAPVEIVKAEEEKLAVANEKLDKFKKQLDNLK